MNKEQRCEKLLADLSRASEMSGGWSARGGQTQSAYVRGDVVDDGIYGLSVESPCT